MLEYIFLILVLLVLLMFVVLILLVQRQKGCQSQLQELQDSLDGTLQENMEKNNRALLSFMGEQQEANRRSVYDMSMMLERRLSSFSVDSEQRLENIRNTMENRISSMQADNNRRLEQMRSVVDEKLQKSLDSRFTESFKLVSERLEQVYKGLGEMQNLAVGVGDLKKTLSGVKTRGILGEIQLGAILDEILTPQQYACNFMVNDKPVEFAVKLPGDGSSAVYLPIDSKFPLDAYAKLTEAYEKGGQEEIRLAVGELRRRVLGFAKDINSKYIDPPLTTDFAIMFLPTESLYAELLRMGLFEQLQREYRVNLAGPSTMAAILNSLQMGFRSLAIQKRSGEVWKVLGAVKTEFDRYQELLLRAQDKLNRANADLDALITTRTKKIQRSLRDVEALPYEETEKYLPGVMEDRHE